MFNKEFSSFSNYTIIVQSISNSVLDVVLPKNHFITSMLVYIGRNGAATDNVLQSGTLTNVMSRQICHRTYFPSSLVSHRVERISNTRFYNFYDKKKHTKKKNFPDSGRIRKNLILPGEIKLKFYFIY